MTIPPFTYKTLCAYLQQGSSRVQKAKFLTKEMDKLGPFQNLETYKADGLPEKIKNFNSIGGANVFHIRAVIKSAEEAENNKTIDKKRILILTVAGIAAIILFTAYSNFSPKIKMVTGMIASIALGCIAFHLPTIEQRKFQKIKENFLHELMQVKAVLKTASSTDKNIKDYYKKLNEFFNE